MNCSTCWFAGDGVSRHCGKCACCPESAQIAARARKRTYRLLKVRDLTPAEQQEMERLIEAEQRDREAEESETLHVIPRDDLIDHPADDDCACGPTPEPVKRDDGSVGWIVVHHSLDGRPTA